MTVTSPSNFGILNAGGQEQIAYLEPIIDTSFEIVTRNATWCYASGNRRRVFTKDWRGVGAGTTSATYVQIAQIPISMSTDRAKMDVHFSRTNCDLKIEIWNTALSVNYTSPEDTSGSTAGAIAITTGIASGFEGIVKIFIKTNAGGTARLLSVRAVERVLASADLP